MTEMNRTDQTGNLGEPAASPRPPAFDRLKPRRGFAEADAFLRAALKYGASDLHLKSGQTPCLRIDGNLRRFDGEARPSDEFEAGILAFLSEEERQRLLADGSVDLAYELDGEARFRVNVYRQESGISLAARIVPRRIPSFDELHLPPVITTIADCRQGLVLVSGATGSGKSTTIAAISNTSTARVTNISSRSTPDAALWQLRGRF